MSAKWIVPVESVHFKSGGLLQRVAIRDEKGVGRMLRFALLCLCVKLQNAVRCLPP